MSRLCKGKERALFGALFMFFVPKNIVAEGCAEILVCDCNEKNEFLHKSVDAQYLD